MSPPRFRAGSAKPWVVDGALLLVAVVWGSSYLATQDLATPETVPAILVLRFSLAAAGLALVTGLRVTVAEWRIGAVLGVALSVVFALETFGVTQTSATNAGLIISLTIVFTPILDRRCLSGAFIFSTLLALLGVFLLTQGHGLTHGQGLSRPSFGDLLMLLAAITRAVSVTLTHRLADGRAVDSGRLTLIQLLTVAVICLPFGVFLGPGLTGTLHRLDGQKWLVLGYLAAAGTVFAFVVQTWAVRRTSPSRVSLLLGTEPVWAALIGVTLAGDQLTVTGGFGVLLILFAVNWGRRLESRAAQITTEDVVP